MLFKHPDFLFSYRVHAYTFSLLIATLLAAGCNLRVVRRMSTITATQLTHKNNCERKLPGIIYEGINNNEWIIILLLAEHQNINCWYRIKKDGE